MSGLQIDACASRSGAQKFTFLTLVGIVQKTQLKFDLRLSRRTPSLSHTTRGYEKTHAHLNSVLEQALATTAVVEALC